MRRQTETETPPLLSTPLMSTFCTANSRRTPKSLMRRSIDDATWRSVEELYTLCGTALCVVDLFIDS